MKKFKPALIAITVTALFLAVSTMDYNDQLSQQAHYCEMTATGHWPQFKNLECDQ